MAINKVIYYGEVLVDMSQVSVNPDALVAGKTALDASGELIAGANPYEKVATDEEVETQEDLIAQIAAALEGKAGGGASSPTISTVSVTPSSNSTSISFPNLSREPKLFYVCQTGSITGDRNNRFVLTVQYDGNKIDGTYFSGEKAISYSDAYFSKSYVNGMLTLTTSSSTNGGYFRSGVAYQLVYVA